MIEREPLERVVEALSRVGSHPLGFRVAGTPEDRATAELIATEMRSIGLTDVALEQVPVDGWHYRGGSVTLSDGTQWEAASLGSFPPTPPTALPASWSRSATAVARCSTGST